MLAIARIELQQSKPQSTNRKHTAHKTDIAFNCKSRTPSTKNISNVVEVNSTTELSFKSTFATRDCSIPKTAVARFKIGFTSFVSCLDATLLPSDFSTFAVLSSDGATYVLSVIGKILLVSAERSIVKTDSIT